MKKYYAMTRWSPYDLQDLRPEWSLKRCAEWLERNQNRLRDNIVEQSWTIIEQMLLITEDDK